MEKIKFITDTASDIPDEALLEYDIEMLSIPIAVDGRDYFERRSFTIQEFYKVLSRAKEIPVTSRIPCDEYAASYQKAYEEGYTDIVNVTINAGGSGINESAQMAVEQFYSQAPDARDKINIHVVDSKLYSIAYGFPIIESAKMAREGKSVREILDYLDDYLSCCEIYLGCYTLSHAKKSGRITAAAAFVGDVLGLRPVISFIDGPTKVVDRVRGDKQLVPRIFSMYEERCDDFDAPVIVISGEEPEYAAQLKQMLQKKLKREVPVYPVGAAIAINSGAKVVAVVLRGKKRR